MTSESKLKNCSFWISLFVLFCTQYAKYFLNVVLTKIIDKLHRVIPLNVTLLNSMPGNQ